MFGRNLRVSYLAAGGALVFVACLSACASSASRLPGAAAGGSLSTDAASASSGPVIATASDTKTCEATGQLISSEGPLLKSAANSGGYGMSIVESGGLGTGIANVLTAGPSGQLGAHVSSLADEQQNIVGGFISSYTAQGMLDDLDAITTDCAALGTPLMAVSP